jgi:hypothetical protein
MTTSDTRRTEIFRFDRVEISVEPWSWEFATVRRVEINAHFTSLKKERSVVWNGRVCSLGNIQSPMARCWVLF